MWHLGGRPAPALSIPPPAATLLPPLCARRPAGKDESDQMDKIFAIVGAPTEATMPGCSKYQNYGMVEGVNRWPARSRLRQASAQPRPACPSPGLLPACIFMRPAKQASPCGGGLCTAR